MLKRAVLFGLVCGVMGMGLSNFAFAETTVVEYFIDKVDSAEGKYIYSYPSGNSLITQVTSTKHSGDVSLKVVLDTSTYSGAAIGHYPFVDLRKIKRGAVEFWVRGESGGENFEVSLLDAEDSDGQKVEVGVMATPKYVTVSTQWQKVQIPISDFPAKGQYWDGKAVHPSTFDAAELKEIKFNVKPADNPGKSSVTIYIDDLKLIDTDIFVR